MEETNLNAELKLKDEIWNALRSVYDPEIGLDIVNLGLVYNVNLVKNENDFTVEIDLTLTSPACPMAGFIIDSIQAAVTRCDENIATVNVQLVWDPPWSKDSISEIGKMELGLL